MLTQSIVVEAVFEDGVLRPVQPVPLPAHQRVTLTIQWPFQPREWPEDVAAIYEEIAEEDLRLAETMWPTVRETWPRDEEAP